MRSPKSLLAVGLAACTITPCMINAVGNVAATLKVGPAPVFSLAAMVLAMVSFVVSWNQRSLIASGLLSASGIIFMIPALSAMGHSLAVVVFPGPILGVIFGSVMIGLGVAMGIRKAKTVTVLPR